MWVHSKKALSILLLTINDKLPNEVIHHYLCFFQEACYTTILMPYHLNYEFSYYSSIIMYRSKKCQSSCKGFSCHRSLCKLILRN